MLRPPPTATLFPYTTLFRSAGARLERQVPRPLLRSAPAPLADKPSVPAKPEPAALWRDLLTAPRSEEHTSELQSRENLVCRLLLEKKKKIKKRDKVRHRYNR